MLNKNQIEKLADHLQSEIHNLLPGYYFSSNDVIEIITNFYYKPIIIINNETGEVRETRFIDIAKEVIESDVELYFKHDFPLKPIKIYIKAEDCKVREELDKYFNKCYAKHYQK
jgi:hypothetical protein